MHRKIFALAVTLLLLPAFAGAAEVYRDGDKSLEVGWWGQAWYQYVEEGEANDKDTHDFLFRRSYFYVKGTATPWFSFFAHLAGDRYGQDGLVADSGRGYGSGIALRDGWVNVKLMEDMLMLQVGRMYVPFTRNYGTTSTKALMGVDLDWTQGGTRGGIFYPNNVGRDDGAVLWGNLMGGMLQYRFMAGDGNDTPDDELRYAGRLSLSLWDPETSWFTEGSYLGKKKVLAIGLGGDTQKDIVGGSGDYNAWTADVHLDMPMGGGSCISAELAYIDVNNAANRVDATPLLAGDDADIYSVKAGYLLPGNVGPGQLMPVVHYEYVDVDDKGNTNDKTHIWGIGAAYYLVGHANKINLDFTWINQDTEEAALNNQKDRMLVTLQFAAGF